MPACLDGSTNSGLHYTPFLSPLHASGGSKHERACPQGRRGSLHGPGHPGCWTMEPGTSFYQEVSGGTGDQALPCNWKVSLDGGTLPVASPNSRTTQACQDTHPLAGASPNHGGGKNLLRSACPGCTQDRHSGSRRLSRRQNIPNVRYHWVSAAPGRAGRTFFPPHPFLYTPSTF